MTNEIKNKISNSLKGKIPWNKGRIKITPLYKSIYGCKKYIEWRHKIFERDNYTCCECHQVGKILNAHHIKRFSYIIKENNIKTLEEAEQCLLLWDINNGITLCSDCHKLTPNYGKRYVI